MATQIQMHVDADGNETATEIVSFSEKNFASSADYKGSGLAVSDNGQTQYVTNPDSLQGHEIVSYQGMQITVDQARQFGVLDAVFDSGTQTTSPADQLAAALATQAAAKAENANSNNPFDAAENSLNDMIASDAMSVEEAQAAATTLGEIELSGMTIEEASKIASGMMDGSINDFDIGHGDRASMMNSVVARNTEMATQVASGELGDQSFQHLTQMAAASPEINTAIQNYAIKRATGQAGGLTWSDLYNDAVAHMNGG